MNKSWFKVRHGGWANNRSTYQCWQDMKQRCNNPKSKQFKNYGARGIRVCGRWEDSELGFENFISDMGIKPDGKTIERINNNGIYNPSNCRWASRNEQCQNKRGLNMIEINGVVHNASAWGRVFGLHRDSVLNRWKKGIPLSAPKQIVVKRHRSWQGEGRT